MMIVPMSPEGSSFRIVPLGDVQVGFRTRYNYSARYWTLDVVSASGEDLVTGIVLVPRVDLLKPYPAVKKLIGGLVLVEYTLGDYQSPHLLGIGSQLLWFPVGEQVPV